MCRTAANASAHLSAGNASAHFSSADATACPDLGVCYPSAGSYDGINCRAYRGSGDPGPGNYRASGQPY